MALPSDRTSREFQAFTLSSTSATALNVFGCATGTSTATSTGQLSINDGQFNRFVLTSSGAAAVQLKST